MEQYSLYGGKVILNYDKTKHIYSVNEKIVYGVTNIIQVLDKPALMYWAVNKAVEYLEANLKPGEALDEIQIKNLLDGAKYAHREVKNKAADIGTMIHQWIEKYIKARVEKKTPPKRPVNKEMKSAIEGFFRWAKENKVNILVSEQKIYSVKYGYAGTYDLEAMVNGKRTIIDFKTGNAIYPEAFLQASAYLKAKEEESGNKYDGGVIILRLSKEDPDKKITAFEAKSIMSGEIKNLIKVFLCCLQIYKWKMALKGQEIINKKNGRVR